MKAAYSTEILLSEELCDITLQNTVVFILTTIETQMAQTSNSLSCSTIGYYFRFLQDIRFLCTLQ